jgi:hypothetical protein
MDARIGSLTRRLSLGAMTIATLAAATGCTSNPKARAQADAAYRAGQLQAVRNEDARKRGIVFTGPISNSLIPWTEGLTLAQAIAAAGWNAKTDPRLIILTRGNEVVTMTPQQALEAADEPMQPGDHVDMLP